MRDKISFEFKPELCIYCHACETACRTWRNPEKGISYRKVVAYEEGCFPDVKVTYVSESCRHCDNPECADVCPVGAISVEEDGAVVVDRDTCIGCGACAGACPYNVPQFGADGTMQKCDMCHGIKPEEMRFPCARMCPTGALSLK